MLSSFLLQKIRPLLDNHKRLIGGFFLGVTASIVVSYWLSTDSDAVTPSALEVAATPQTKPQKERSKSVISAIDSVVTADPVSHEPKHFIRVVKKDDTLSAIFEGADIGQKVMFNVLEADNDALVLDALRPGNRIGFWFDDKDQLQKMELFLSPTEQAVFLRDDTGYFHYQAIVVPGVWKNRVVHGVISNSFYVSAMQAGLKPQSISEIETLLKDKVNFSKNIRPGDHFNVLLKEQYVDGKLTDNVDVTGVELLNGQHRFTAFLADNGNYYDEKGQSLNRAFSRYPTKRHYRVSSSFNPRRRNPVTGRIAPHNGVDLAAPMHTPVLATADGVVTLTNGHHPFAGKYIVIRNSSRYYTRFLHLSKILVRKGQRVYRGQRIALSGSTGRSTGPHLHYELHINNRAVNPMTAHIPLANPIGKKVRSQFLKTVQWRLAAMETEANPVVVSRQPTTSVDGNTKG